jgi:hypothetical protein
MGDTGMFEKDQGIASPGGNRRGLSRRSFLSSLGATAAASLAGGCAFKKCELAADTPIPDLIAHLNHNIDQLNSWRSTMVKVKPFGGMLLAPSVSASMAVERPRNFRLQAQAVTIDVADLGSNEDRFWFWVKNDEDPVILTARHECLGEAQRVMPMTFDPDWLIETLGVIPIDENEVKVEKHPTDPKRVFLRRKRSAPDGTPIDLVSTVDTCQGVIVDHSLSNLKGDIIALARLSEHERDGKTGVVLPHTVELSWPLAKMGLAFRIGAIEVNPTTISNKLFAMPHIADCRVHDIGGEVEQAAGPGRTKV